MRLYRRQFVIGPEPMLPDRTWRPRDLGAGRVLSHSSDLPVRESEHGLVVGSAVPSGENHPGGWAGRWVLVSGTTLGLDACGLLGVFYRDGWLSSSPELLRLIPPELPQPEERLVYESGLDWFPPPRSGIPGVWRLLPSQTIDIATGELRHRPLLVHSDADRQALAEMLVASLVNLGERRVIVPLTGGRDSRVLRLRADRWTRPGCQRRFRGRVRGQPDVKLEQGGCY